MNKKGFTLVELMVVIAIMAVIMLIVVPNVTGMLKKIDNEKYQRFLSDVFLATEAYVQKNIENYPEIKEENNKIYVYYTELIESNYLKSTTYDPKNKKQVKEEDYTVEVYLNEDKEYKYKVYEEHYVPIYIGNITQNLLDNNTDYGNYTYMGGTYLKGVQESNYVWYNGFLWRIMGKNSDGTIKLITEENVGTVAWGASGAGDWNAEGYLKDWLNNYFYSNLDSSKTDIIKQDSEWCINTTTSSTSARTDCTGGTLVESKVGLISIDEYNLSGASSTNNTYGLVNSQYFWTLTPYSASYAWCVNDSGNAYDSGVTNAHGARPVINVSANATITGGNGTLGDSYILNQTTSNKTGKLNENASSGEYVSLDSKTYRVVSKDNIGTKLIYDGYYEETAGTPTMMTYGTDNVFSVSTGIGLKLNGDILTWLGNSSKIISSNWYQTAGFGFGTTYTTILNDITNPINAKVGLIRVGEMMSGISASILTKNYTVRSAMGNAKNYWTMNKYTSASGAWGEGSGVASNIGVTDTFGVRPVVVVDTSTTITSGNGTLGSPYIID